MKYKNVFVAFPEPELVETSFTCFDNLILGIICSLFISAGIALFI